MATQTVGEMLDHTPMAFSKKYPFKTPSEIAETDPSYVIWMYKNINPKPCSLALYNACQAEMQNSRCDDDYERYQDSGFPEEF